MSVDPMARPARPVAAPQSGVYPSALEGSGTLANTDAGFQLTYNPVAGDVVVRVAGAGILTGRGRPVGADPLRDLLGPRCYGLRVILDLEKVVGVETSGVALLVQTAERFAAGGGKLVLCAVPPQVTSLLQILDMDLPFAVAADETAARAAVTA